MKKCWDSQKIYAPSLMDFSKIFDWLSHYLLFVKVNAFGFDGKSLADLFPMHPFSTPWRRQKTIMFSGGRENVHWEQMG